MTSAHCSGVIDATSVNTPTPALLTRMSRPPNRATAASTARCASAWRRTSACNVSTPPGPAPSIARRAAERCAALRAVTATCTPSTASACAIASPMPRDPPVTIATLPRIDSITRTFCCRLTSFPRRTQRLRTISGLYNIVAMQHAAVIGAGELGGAIAHLVARRDVARAITLVDESGDVAAGKALDIAQAAAIEGFATALAGTADVAMVAGAAMIVVADRVPGG